MTISLTGPMGSGKSSVGRKLATLLSDMCAAGKREGRVRHIDLDEYIVNREGRSISAIFAESGEAAFRVIETRCLCEVLDWAEGKGACCGLFPQRVPDMLVLSLGGGAVIKNSEIIRQRTFCVYLRSSVDTLTKRLGANTAKRPLLASEPQAELRSRVEALLNERRALYERAAHISVWTEGLSVYETALEIIKRINAR